VALAGAVRGDQDISGDELTLRAIEDIEDTGGGQARSGDTRRLAPGAFSLDFTDRSVR
jgi:hypothetical protein